MSDRPVFHEELGKFFRGVREAREFGLRQAAQIAEQKGLRAITRQVLHSIETGRTKNIGPDVLRELSVLYNRPYEVLALPVIAEQYGISPKLSDLSGHARTGQRLSHPSKGESDVPASDRALKERIDRDKESATEIRTVIARLTRVAATLDEQDGEVAMPPAGRRARHRKTG